MEKYKTIILIEKIRKCLEDGKPQEALAIAEGIDKKKLKNMSDLSVVAESYFQNVKYEEAKKLYIRIYQKTPSRRIVAQLVHLSIKLNDIEESNHYLKEFIRIAPKDFYQYIFRYSIDKMAKAPLVKLIEDLVDLKHAEYIESWAYELAKLYHKAGMKDECLAECDDIVLWFGSGEYVERARALRAYYRGEIQIDEAVIMNKSEQADESIAKEKISSTEEKTHEEFEADIINDVQVEEEFEDNVVDDSEERKFEDTQNYELEDVKEENESLIENIQDNTQVDLPENLQVNTQDSSSNDDADFEVNSEKLSEEYFEELSEEHCDSFSQESFKYDENIDDDFLNLESSLAEQMELTFQEQDRLTKEEDELRERSEDEFRDKSQVKLSDRAYHELSEDLLTEIENEFGVTLPDESSVEEKGDTDLNQISSSTDFAQPSQSTEIEREVKAEIRRLLKEKDLNELAATMEMLVDTNSVSEQTSKEMEEDKSYDDVIESQVYPTVSPKKQKKINLKVLTNEQLIGEEEEDLLDQLTRNQVSLLDIFGNFMRMELVRKQLVRSMDQILTQRSKNVILTGESQSGKTRLAKSYAKWLHRMRLIHSTKIALIDGVKLNHMNLLEKKEQLKDCVIIIENAGMITKETMKSLLELSNLYQNNIAIILEDTRESINHLLRGNSQLNSIFNNRIHLHKYTLEDYMGFAYDYITEHDYEIEMEAFIALQNEFSEFMQKKRENALKAIFSYLDDIIQKSENRSAQQLKEISQSGHFADTELMVVKKEDIKS